MGRSFAARLAVIVCLASRPDLAFAHDIPNARIDRATQVTIAPGRLRVDYEVSLAELTLAQDLRQLDPDAELGGEGGRPALFERYAQVVAPLNARGFLVRVGAAEVELATLGHEIAVEGHPRFTFHFEASLPPDGHLTLADTNYASSEGPVRLACRVDPAVSARGDLPPADLEAIPIRAAWELSDREEAATRRLTLDYAPAATQARPVALTAAPPTPTPESAPARPADAGLTRFLDGGSPASRIAWLLAAFALGLAHAIQPGHGKALIAAASLGDLGSSRRGAALGMMTAVVHLGSVAALAALLWLLDFRQYDWAHALLTRGAGFAVAVVGSFRLGRALAGSGDRTDLFEFAAHPSARPTAGLFSLALAGGLVPCWDAVALLIVAHAAGRLLWGMALLVAFSLGLGVVLVAVGWLAGRVRRRFAALGEANSTDPRLRWLTGASALALLIIGLGLLART